MDVVNLILAPPGDDRWRLALDLGDAAPVTHTRRIYAGWSDIMSMSNIKALCFDTGGTILDWHTGMRTALAEVGARHGMERDWAGLANEFAVVPSN